MRRPGGQLHAQRRTYTGNGIETRMRTGAQRFIERLARQTAGPLYFSHASRTGLLHVGFLWLQRYDEGLLTEPLGSPGGTLPSSVEARSGLPG